MRPLFLLPLVLLLSACTFSPVYLRADNARLSAEVKTPQGPLVFDCNPVQDALARGQRLTYKAWEDTFSCPSQDGRATLTLALIEPIDEYKTAYVDKEQPGLPPRREAVTVRVQPPSRIRVTVLMDGEKGLSSVTYQGEAKRTSGKAFNPFFASSQGATFEALLENGVQVKGRYHFAWEK